MLRLYSFILEIKRIHGHADAFLYSILCAVNILSIVSSLTGVLNWLIGEIDMPYVVSYFANMLVHFYP